MQAPISEDQWKQHRREAIAAMPDVIEAVGLPEVLLEYQSRAISLLDGTAMERVLFIEKSRRIGMTWGLAAYAVLRAGRDRTAGGMDVMYISYSQEMTREFIDACAMWAQAFSVAADEADEVLFDGGGEGEKAIQAFRIRFASGFEVMALSSAPRSLRGKQGVVIIDEAAFVDDLAELLKAALAFLMWGGQVVVCSTHDGSDNVFNQYVQDILGGRSKYAHMRVDLDDALMAGLFQRICLKQGAEWTPEAEANWRQEIIDFYGGSADEELFCVASQGSGTWLPAPLIEARMTAEGHVLRLELPNDYLHLSEQKQAELMAPFLKNLEAVLATIDLECDYSFGFDFGRVSDLSTVSLLAIKQRLKRSEKLSVEMRNVPGDEQKLVVSKILERVRSRLVGAAFDATGMGWTVAEDMGRKFGLREDPEGSGLVMAIKFTEEWYRLQMPPLKTAFEDDQIEIIPDAEHITDLRMIKLIRGIPRVPNVREGEKGKKRHGDYGIALALAHYASRLRWVEYDYRAASAVSTPDPTPDRFMNEPNEETGRGWWSRPLGSKLRGFM